MRWCEQVSAEYKRELYSENLTDLQNYISNLSFDFKDEEDEEVDENTVIKSEIVSTYPDPQKYGWTKNFQILHKIEKFGVYRFHEYCEVNPVTMGAIELLKTLQKTNEETYGEFGQCSWGGVLSRTIQALDLHWD